MLIYGFGALDQAIVGCLALWRSERIGDLMVSEELGLWVGDITGNWEGD